MVCYMCRFINISILYLNHLFIIINNVMVLVTSKLIISFIMYSSMDYCLPEIYDNKLIL